MTYLDEEIEDLKSYRNNIKNKSDVELSSISIANDNSEFYRIKLSSYMRENNL